MKTLYKRSTTGKVSEWSIEVEANKFRTISGFTDGLKITSDWTVCEGKSYNSSNEQALKQAQSLHKKKKELGAFEDIKDIDKEVHFKPMLADKWGDRKSKIKYPIFSQPKLDGVRCIVKSDGMWSRNGKKIISAPHIYEALKPLFDNDPFLIFDGELYTDKLANDFNKLISLVSKKKPEPEDLVECEKYIEYHIYDVPSNSGTFHKRNFYLWLLRNQLPKCCKIVETVILNSEQEVKDTFTKYIEAGYEGQMLRVNDVYENKRSKFLLKDKEMDTDEFTILGVKEGQGKLANKVGKVTIKTKNGVELESAVNGTHDFLADLWTRRNELIGKEATVRFFGYTPDGSLRFPKVIEVDRWAYE